MRKVVVHMHTTLDGRIAKPDGSFWSPFPWGEDEQLWLNTQFATADTWVFGRNVYEAVAPWWTMVANGELPDDVKQVTPAQAEFAAIFAGLSKVVFSRTLSSSPERTVIRDDIGTALSERKTDGGGDVIISCGPEALAVLAVNRELIDEHLVVIHPAVIASGPRLFDEVSTETAFRLVDHRVFDGGAVVLRYASHWDVALL